MEKYFENILFLNINNCDLRTFQNFPNLKIIKELDASRQLGSELAIDKHQQEMERTKLEREL